MYQPTTQYNTQYFNPLPKKHGSSLKPYKIERFREEGHYGFVSLKNILGMTEYKNTSIEEIRNEDYELNRKPSAIFYNVSLNNLPPLRSQQSSFSGTTYPSNTQAPSFMQNTANVWGTTNKTTEVLKPIDNLTTNYPAPSQTSYATTTQTAANPWNTFGTTNTQTANNPWAGTATMENKPTPWNTQTAATTQSNMASQPNTTTQPSFFPQQSAYQPQAANQTASQTNTAWNFTQPLSSQQNNNLSFNVPKQQESFQQQNQSFMPQTAYNYPQQTTCQDTVNNDPYSVSLIKFDTSPVQEISIKKLLTKDLFEEEKKEEEVKLEINTKNKHEATTRRLDKKQKIYTIPSSETIKDMVVVKNLRICIENKACIDYLEDVKGCDVILEQKIVIAKPFIFMADEKGEGLNKRARITMNEFWPFFRGKLIKTNMSHYPEKGVIDRFIYELKNDEALHFVSYDIDSGCYVYEVESFESNSK